MMGKIRRIDLYKEVYICMCIERVCVTIKAEDENTTIEGCLKAKLYNFSVVICARQSRLSFVSVYSISYTLCEYSEFDFRSPEQPAHARAITKASSIASLSI